jgi:hypothetical protein
MVEVKSVTKSHPEKFPNPMENQYKKYDSSNPVATGIRSNCDRAQFH